jgi:hypothetical protein
MTNKDSQLLSVIEFCNKKLFLRGGGGSDPIGAMDVCVCSVCVYFVSTPCGGG